MTDEEGLSKSRLRKQAEKQLADQQEEWELSDPSEMKKVLHELRVHQIELEMQNDELMKTQKALEQSRDRYLYLFNEAPVGYVILDAMGNVLQSNQTFLYMVDREHHQLKGRPFSTLLPETDQAIFNGRFKALLNHPRGKQLELQIIGKDGQIFQASLEGANPSAFLSEESHVDGESAILLIINDISERKKAEALVQQSLTEKTTLLQEIHHRVKNNMQVISSIMGLQNKSTDDDRVKEILQDCQLRVQTMSFVHETLYRSDNLSQIDMGRYVERLVKSVEMSFYNKRDYIHTEIEAENLVINVEQATPVGLIINELISNSFKYAFPDGKTGRIHVQLKQIDQDRVKLNVSDNGVGIPDDLNPETTKSLGLNLVKILSENQLHGTLSYHSKGGTHFEIEFPLRI